MEELKLIIADARNAVEDFSKSLTIDLALFPALVLDTIQSGQIQKFECAVEITWKALKKYLLKENGLDLASPKPVIKACLENKKCDYAEYETLIEMLDARNKLSHIYKKAMLKAILACLPKYAQTLTAVIGRI